MRKFLLIFIAIANLCFLLTSCGVDDGLRPNTIVTETVTTDVIYAGDNTYFELTAHQISSISESNSEHYKSLSVGDIVRVNAEIRTETVNSGAAGGTVYITFEEILDIDIVSDEYYEDNNFGAIPLKNMTVAKDFESTLRYNAWKYIYNEDKDCYVSIIATTFGNQKAVVIENGVVIGKYDRFVTIPKNGFDNLLLVNDDVAISEIEAGLENNDYSRFYLIAKASFSSTYFKENNIHNLTLDYAYRGNNEFVSLSESHYSHLNLSEFTDCLDYEIGAIFRINADFIDISLRHQGNVADDRIIDKLHSIERISPQTQNSSENIDVMQFSPTTPFSDWYQYVYFVSITYAKQAYNTDTGKYIMMLSIPATSEYYAYYKIFEEGEHVGDFNQLQTFDNHKTNIRHVVFFNNRVGERVFTLEDLESKLESGNLSDIYYIGYGDLDVLFPD